jgi:hypothetical protein
MKRPLHAVDNFFKRRVMNSFAKPDECKAIAQVRREINGDNLQRLAELREPFYPRPIAEICFEG